VPADHGFGLNDDQELLPSRPAPGQEDPEGPVGWSDPRSAPSLGEGGKLLTESEFDDRLLASASEEGRNAAEEEHQEFEQGPHREVHLVRNHGPLRD